MGYKPTSLTWKGLNPMLNRKVPTKLDLELATKASEEIKVAEAHYNNINAVDSPSASDGFDTEWGKVIAGYTKNNKIRIFLTNEHETRPLSELECERRGKIWEEVRHVFLPT